MVPLTFKHLFHQLLHQQPAGIGWMQKDSFGWQLDNSIGFQYKQTNVYKFWNDLCLVLRKSGTMNEKSIENGYKIGS